MSRVVVLPSPEALARAAAERVVTAASNAIAARGRFVVALTGGSTPKILYRLLASPEFAGAVDWTRVHAFWGDERCRPPDDPASNYRMARETLLDHVPIPPAQVHRMHGEDEPTQAAAAYERELRVTFPDGLARFDLMLLGMGSNGHTASLFPGLSAVRERQRWVVAEDVAAVAMWRITLTPVAINSAAEILIVVAGADKAAMLARVLEGPRAVDELPVQAIAPEGGTLTWLVDADSAAALRNHGTPKELRRS